MFSKYSVKKPYTVLVGVVLVLVLGFVSLTKMTTDLLPDMSFQYALIITTDIGASPEKVESDVTAPIEAAMATTSNIKNITSTSYNSYSIVVCEYEQSANMDSVVIEIQQELDQLSGSWDDSVGSPMIMKINPDMLPVMIAAVDMDEMDESELSDYVNNELIPLLESVEGVAQVSATGLLEKSIQVTLDQEKIDAWNEKIKESIDGQFEDARKELEDAAAEVESGQQQLTEGQQQLTDALEQTAGQKESLYETEAELKEQLTELKTQRDTLLQIQDGIKTFVASTEYTELSVLTTALPQLEEMLTELESQFAEIRQPLEEGMAELDETSSSLGEELQTALTAIQNRITELQTLIGLAQNAGLPTEELSDSLTRMQERLTLLQTQIIEVLVTGTITSDLTNALDSVEEELAELHDRITEGEAALTAANEQIASQFAGLSAMGITVNGYEDLPEAAATVGTMVTQIKTGIAAIESALDQVETGKTALSDAVDTINSNAALAAIQSAQGAAQLVQAAASLEEAQNTLDQAKDSAYEAADLDNILTVDTVAALLLAQNFDMPAGYAYEGNVSYLVRVGEAVKSLEELEDLVLMDMGMDEVGILRLSDVADIEMVDNSGESYTVINGNPGIALSMEKQTGYSTGEVTDRLLDKFDSLENANGNLHLTVLMNQGVYIDIVVDSVVQNMIIGAILAIIILLLFLKDFKPTIVIACSIPLSVVAAIVLMYFTGITLNIISLSGLTLGVGMLVDNSIVVIENIDRFRSMGYSVKRAAVEGANQVVGAIVASTLTTVSVYAPIIFTEGITRQLFVDLALTIAYTLVASLLVAMTFVPAMSTVVMKKKKEIRHPWFDAFKELYGRFLETCLRFKPVVFVVSVLLLVLSTIAALSRGMSFMDMDMETGQMTVTVSPKEGETLTFSELTELSDEVLERISGIEGIDTIAATAGGSTAMSLMGGGSDSVSMYILTDEDSKRSESEISDEILERTADLDCIVDTGSDSMDYSAYFGSGISVEIKGADLQTLQSLAADVAQILENTDGTVDVEDGLDEASPQLTITVDKEKAAEYGYTVGQVFQLVYSKMASSTSATTISTDVDSYEVYLRTEEQSEVNLEDIRNLTFTHTNEDGEEEEILLTEICTMEESTTLSTIYRDAQSRYLTVSCGIDEEHNVTLVGSEIQKELDRMEIPEGYSVSMAGEDDTINDAMEQLVLMLVLAVVFIYLIMVAQFQSLASPFIIMFSIPLAFTGGFIALFLTGTEVSVVSMLGFIMLAGLIVNNGIVLIEYINQARREGMKKKEAIIDAGKTRVRPILMTVLTTILAMSTSAIGIGKGSEMMKPMAVTIIGGLIYGTLLTLIVIPCIYDAFHREKNMVEEEL